MLQFKSIYPYGLNTQINNINLKKISNACNLFYNFNDSINMNKGKSGSHKFTKINCIMPIIWIKDVEIKFSSTYNVKSFKTGVFKLRINVLQKIKKVF